MKYCFNFKIQLLYGIITFLLALGIIYVSTRQLNWITSGIVGIFEFAIAGFYTKKKCK